MSPTRNLPCTEVDVVETASVIWREVLLNSYRDKALSCALGLKYLHGYDRTSISVSFMKLKFCSLGTQRPSINWAVSEAHLLR
jgi:hypothetical protein